MSQGRTSGSSTDGQHKKKGLLEFGPLRFIGSKVKIFLGGGEWEGH
jgi:hypothetical protein